MESGVWGLGFWGLGLGFWVLGFVWGSGFSVQGSFDFRLRVQISVPVVWGLVTFTVLDEAGERGGQRLHRRRQEPLLTQRGRHRFRARRGQLTMFPSHEGTTYKVLTVPGGETSTVDVFYRWQPFFTLCGSQIIRTTRQDQMIVSPCYRVISSTRVGVLTHLFPSKILQLPQDETSHFTG